MEEGRGLNEGVTTKRLEISGDHLGSWLPSSTSTLISQHRIPFSIFSVCLLLILKDYFRCNSLVKNSPVLMILIYFYVFMNTLFKKIFIIMFS